MIGRVVREFRVFFVSRFHEEIQTQEYPLFVEASEVNIFLFYFNLGSHERKAKI